MSPRPSYVNPLTGIERLLIDGTNLLHALRRGSPAAPPAALIGRLRGVIEMPVRIELMFDGPAEGGLRDTRIASGLVVHYSGRVSADSVLARAVSEAVDPSTILVVTDDVDLRHQVTRRGGRTAGAQWLIGRLERSRLESPSIARPKPPIDTTAGTGAGGPGSSGDDDGAPGWQPGRGATTKRGNPKRAPKSSRTPQPGPRR